jgi:hypothetical protein
VAVSGPGDVINREPWRERNGRGRHPSEGHDVSMEVGLVDEATLQGNVGNALTCGEMVGRTVETDQLCRVWE